MRLNKNRTFSIFLTIICTVGSVHAEEKQNIQIASQSLASALAELGNETGLQVTAARELVIDKTSSEVSGVMTPKEGLLRLLDGTGLTYQSLDRDGAVLLPALNFNGIVAQDDLFDLGTVIVTGERVERDLFNTASSVRAYNAEELEDNFQNSEFERVIGDAANITTLGISNNTPVIRGQLSGGPVGGALAAVTGQLPRATLTVDGRPLSFNELSFSPTSIWDVDTLEVFRGPQTTSQGANSIAGAFNIRTRDPVFEPEFAARAEVASRGGYILSFMGNTLLSDSVAARFAFDRQSQDGYITFPSGNLNPDAEASEQMTARFKVLWEPISLPELSTKLTVTYSDFNRPQSQNVIEPFNALVSNNPTPYIAAFKGESLTFTHDFSYDLGAGLSIRNQLTFTDFEAARVTANPTPASPLDPAVATLEGEEVINELILNYAPEGGVFSGLAGFYIRDSNESSPPGELFVIDDEKLGYGIFGEATYRFANGFDVTAGIRYQENEQQRTTNAPAAGLGPLSFDETFEAWLPKFGVGYDFNDDVRMSFQVSRGFNPGGVGTCFNCLFVLPEPLFRFEDETVWNYELGLRGRFLDNRLFIAANLFYSDFDDYQFLVPVPVPPLGDQSIISNAESVETYGLEIDTDYAVNERLRLIGSLGLLQTDVKKFSGSAAAATSVVGNDLPFAPDVTISLGFDYEVTPEFVVGGQMRYTDGYFSDIENSQSGRVSDFTTVDLRASYQMTDVAQVYVYVNNVLDEVAPLSILAGVSPRVGVTTTPREIGFGVRATW